MKSKILAISIFLLAFLPNLVSATGYKALPDSLITIDKVYEYTFSEPKKAIYIIKELELDKNTEPYKLWITKGDFYFNTGNYYKAIRCFENALEDKKSKDNIDTYMQLLHRMISCYDAVLNDSKKSEYIARLMKSSIKYKDSAMHSIALFNMGKTIYNQGNRNDGYMQMEKATGIMERSSYQYKFDNLRYNYNTLLVFYKKDSLYNEALKTLGKLSKIVTAETGDETKMQGLACRDLKNLYAHKAVILMSLGKTAEADSAYARYSQYDNDLSYDNYLIAPYLFAKGRLDEIIENNSKRERMYIKAKDTVNYNMATIKKTLASAYLQRGNYKKAAKYYSELAELRDSIKIREQKSSALELAAIYETHQKDLLLHKQKGMMKRAMIYISLISIIVIIFAILLYKTHIYNRNILKKNQAMAQTIKNLLTSKEELYNLKTFLTDHNINTTENAVPGNEVPESSSDHVILQENGEDNSKKEYSVCEKEADISSIKDDDDEEEDEKSERANQPLNENDKILFQKIENEILKNNLFLKPGFSREDIIKKINVPKNKFAKLFKEYAGINFPRYINDLRLEFAAKKLIELPHYTIGAISEMSGISTVQTFHRLFYEKFGMTPSEFREYNKKPQGE